MSRNLIKFFFQWAKKKITHIYIEKKEAERKI